MKMQTALLKSTALLSALGLLVIGTVAALAQNKPAQPDPHAQHQAQGQPQGLTPAGAPDGSVADQLAQLKAKMAQLEAAMHQRNPNMPPAMQSNPAPMRPGGGRMNPPMGQMPPGAPMNQMPPAGPGAGMNNMNMPPAAPGGAMPAPGGMPMQDGMMMGGGNQMQSGGGMSMMQMMQQMETMGMMGMMGNMGGQAGMAGMTMPPSALPGFPGASHIYHIGATGFFLDHPQHITLTLEQQTALNGMKEKSSMEQGEMARKIEQAEQELWQLTASDQPDIKLIDAKVREIGNLNAEKRIAFVRAVGEAAKLLTDDQRKALLGQTPPQPAQMPSQMEHK